MIHLDNVSFSYTPQEGAILKDISIQIAPGSHVVITGPDGAGKTTLAKLIRGLLEPTSGSVARPGNPTAEIGYLGGDPRDSFVGVSVREDIVFGLENLGLPLPEMQERLRAAVEAVGLDSIETRLIERLSGGEQQKTALAGVLALGVSVLVLDEALNMLDRRARRGIRSLLDDLRNERTITVVEITNNPEEILSAPRIILLSAGKTAFDGSPEAFLRSAAGLRWAGMTEGVGALAAGLFERGVLSRAPASVGDLADILIKKINK
jgi:energy-coupling factor transport system ATP-binding protein